MNPARPETDRPPSTQLRKAVFGGALNNAVAGLLCSLITRLAGVLAWCQPTKGIAIAASVAGLWISSTVLAATTWYVSPNGTDANAGTSWASAKQTAQAAVNAATDGDTVLLSDGVYLLTSPVKITSA